ncbi:MAG: glycosyltransferase [Hydrotalea sp.]|nr:glycosyltransferase [Hydrotalea sp.]
MPNLNNKTILFLLPAMVAGGVEGFTLEACDAVTARGGRALVASSGGAMVAALKKNGGQHIYVPFKKSWLRFLPPLVFLKLYQQTKNKKIDLIYAASRTPAWYGWCLAKLLKIPFITGFHGIYSGYDFPPKKLYNRIMTMGDAIHAVSIFVERHITQIYKPKKPIAVIYGGVDCNALSPGNITTADRNHAAAVLSTLFPHYASQRIIFMPGRVTSLKGQWFLLKTFIQLVGQQQHEFDDAVLLLQSVGKRKSIKQLQTMMRKHHLQNRVGFLPYQENLLPFYDASAVVVNASRRPESFGRTVVEAMALERVTIAPNYGAAVEQINDGVNGFLFVAESSGSLGHALQRALLLSEKQQQAIGREARTTVLEKFSLRDKQEQLTKLFAEVIAG